MASKKKSEVKTNKMFRRKKKTTKIVFEGVYLVL